MIPRQITYEVFDEYGNPAQVTETFYFNLSKPELIKLQVEYKQGFVEMLQEIIKTEDNKELVKQFDTLILMSFGVRSEDGRRFIKSPELAKEFSQTDAYNVLFAELATSELEAAKFIQGILPKDMQGAMENELAPVLPTPAV